VVEDFESYDDKCNAIFYTWHDGTGYQAYVDCGITAVPGNGTGATVGNPQAPYAERTITHSGMQSLPFGYDNTKSTTSEAELTFATPQDWTANGLKSLSLWFYGTAGNGGQLYIKIDNTKVVYDGDATDIGRTAWQPWNIDLSTVNGGNVKGVRKLGIGVEGGATGKLYIDDIRLYPKTPELITPVQPSNTGLIGRYAMENNVQDGSGSGNNGTLVGAPSYVQGLAGYGMAMQFNGSTDCVDLGKKAVFNPTGSLSIAVWANITAWTENWGHVMVGNRGEDNLGWQLRRRDSNKICFTTRMIGDDDTGTSVDAPLNEWVHIGAVYDNANNTKRIYINGREDVVVSTTPGTIPAANHNVYIGARANSANTGQEGFFTGMLDEVRVYTRALSDAEIGGLAGRTKPMHKPF
jgi:hypothetical protein